MPPTSQLSSSSSSRSKSPSSKSPSSKSPSSSSPSSSSSRSKSPSSSSSRSKSPSSSSSRSKSPSSSSSRSKSPSSSSSRSKSPRSKSPSSSSSRSKSPRSSSPRSTTKHRAASKLQRTFRKARNRGFCSICFSYYAPSQIVSLQCGHTFHKDCIGDWFERNRSCPVCRAVVEDKEYPLEIEGTIITPEERIHDRQTIATIRAFARDMAARSAARSATRSATRSAARPLARAAARRERDTAIGYEAAVLEKASANKAALIQAAKSMTASAENLMIEAVALKNIQDGYWKIATQQALKNADAALDELKAVALLDEPNELSPRESLEPLRTQASTIKREATRYLSELNQ